MLLQPYDVSKELKSLDRVLVEYERARNQRIKVGIVDGKRCMKKFNYCEKCRKHDKLLNKDLIHNTKFVKNHHLNEDDIKVSNSRVIGEKLQKRHRKFKRCFAV